MIGKAFIFIRLYQALPARLRVPQPRVAFSHVSHKVLAFDTPLLPMALGEID